jgi:DHA3 family multidrug efflux protein-like MFS transporter
MKQFYHVLVNTLLANVTTSYLWFALVFWVYLETRSVLATGIIGGTYMLLIALLSMVFGTIVDRHKKKNVMVAATVVTFIAYGLAGVIFLIIPSEQLVNWMTPGFWLFGGVILIGAVVENMRNIALSTTVTLLVPAEKRANANGLVGTVQGLAFMVTSVFSGLSIGLLGMGWTLAIAITLTGLALLHLSFLAIKEDHIVHDPELDNKKVDIKGSIAAIKVVPGLFALIIFSTFNNLIGGVYMALMDPYGLTLFSVEWWGIILGITSTGFIIGGLLIAKFGLGKSPIRTLLFANIAMGLVGALFTIREWWPLFAVGMFIYMILFPIIEAAEQTTIQKVVPFKKQGRVFGFAQSVEAAAAPITSFLIAPIAEFFIIPYLNDPAGQAQFSGLLGTGDARGIALIFLVAGMIVILVACLAFMTKSYQKLSSFYNTTPASEPSK